MFRVATLQQLTIKLKYFMDEYKFKHRRASLFDWILPVALFFGSNWIAYHFFTPKMMLVWLFIIMVALLIIGLQAIQIRKYNEEYVAHQKTSQAPPMKRFWEGGFLDVPLDKNEEILKSLHNNPPYQTEEPEDDAINGEPIPNGKISKISGDRASSRVTEQNGEGRAPGPRYALGRSIKYSEDALDFRKSLLKSKEEETSRIEEIPQEKWRDWHISSDIRSQAIPRPKGKEEPKVVFLNQKVIPKQKMELQEKRRREIEEQRKKELEEKLRKEEEEKERIAAERKKKQAEEELQKLKEEAKRAEENRKKLEEDRKKLEEENKKRQAEAEKNQSSGSGGLLNQAGGSGGLIRPRVEEEKQGGGAGGAQGNMQVSKAQGKTPVYNMKDDELKKMVEKQSKEVGALQPFKLTPEQMEEAARRIAGGYDIANPHNELRGNLNKMTNDPPSLKKFACKIILLLKTYQSGTTEDSKKLFLSLVDQAIQRFIARSKEAIETRPKDILSRVIVSHVIDIEIPGFIDTLIYHITSKIKLLIPEIVTRKPGQSERDYLQELGYEYERDGTPEQQENYENRVKGYSILFFGLLALDIRDIFVDVYDEPNDAIPGFQQMVFTRTKSYRWMFWKYVKMLLASPIQLMSAAVLTSLVRYCHFMLRKERDATTALLNIIRLKYFPKLEAFRNSIASSNAYTPAQKLSCKNCTTELEGHLKEFERTGDIANWFEREN